MAPVDDAKQARAALLCSLVGTVLDLRRGSADASARPVGELAAPGKPMIVETVRRLAKEPHLSGRQLAVELDISLSRLARVFKREMGMSLVEYRNRLRLERFQTLLDAGGENLHDAARRAGFGSYAQFHRVFRALRGGTPREALRTRGSAPQARVTSRARRSHLHVHPQNRHRRDADVDALAAHVERRKLADRLRVGACCTRSAWPSGPGRARRARAPPGAPFFARLLRITNEATFFCVSLNAYTLTLS